MWSIANVMFASLRLGHLLDLERLQDFGFLYLLQQSERAIIDFAAYSLFTFAFFYAIVSRFHHARKRGKVLAESFFIFVISLIIQGIVLACGYPSAEALADDAATTNMLCALDARFVLLIVLAAISHVALIATVTASVWQRKWYANNVGVHLLIGLPTSLALILFSMPANVVELGEPGWLFYLWYGCMPLALAASCATELRPPFLLKLSGAATSS